jgi:sulfate transport system substrate-binding protein
MKLWQYALKQQDSASDLSISGFKPNSFKSFVSFSLVGASLSAMGGVVMSGGTQRSLATQPFNSLIAQSKSAELTLVSFAVTKAAHDAILPKFVQTWKKERGQTLTFQQSYGGSGSQTRAVIDGLEADVVHLALASDVSKNEKAGLIKPGWEKKAPNGGIVTKSVVALVVRKGNPKGIKTWADLAKNGVSVITADPKTSGVARWNFLALWNAAIKTGASEAQAKQFVTKVYKNVPILAKDAREATDTFYRQGQGDVLLNYENEIILADKKVADLPYIIPSVNISIDNPVAVVDKNVDKHGTRQAAEGFVKYLFTPEAQREFAKFGFRPVNSTVEKEIGYKFPKINRLGTVKDYGGWDAVQKKFFADGALDLLRESVRWRELMNRPLKDEVRRTARASPSSI